MKEMIQQLEKLGQSYSIKQSDVSAILKLNGASTSQAQKLLTQSQEHMCLLLPDDDED